MKELRGTDPARAASHSLLKLTGLSLCTLQMVSPRRLPTLSTVSWGKSRSGVCGIEFVTMTSVKTPEPSLSTAGGGGYLSRLHGMAVDNFVAATVVLATGEAVEAKGPNPAIALAGKAMPLLGPLFRLEAVLQALVLTLELRVPGLLLHGRARKQRPGDERQRRQADLRTPPRQDSPAN